MVREIGRLGSLEKLQNRFFPVDREKILGNWCLRRLNKSCATLMSSIYVTCVYFLSSALATSEKKIYVFACSLLGSAFLYRTLTKRVFTYCEGVKDAIDKMQSIDSLRELLDQSKKMGSIHITIDESVDRDSAGISFVGKFFTIKLPKDLSVDEKIERIVFELYNLLSSSNLESLYQRANMNIICVDEYVREFEKVEWGTANRRSALLNPLIQSGNINLPPFVIVEDFELFYLLQQASSHSAVIAQRFNRIKKAHYNGTLPEYLKQEDFRKVVLLIGRILFLRYGQEDQRSMAKFKIGEAMAHFMQTNDAHSQRLLFFILSIITQNEQRLCRLSYNSSFQREKATCF